MSEPIILSPITPPEGTCIPGNAQELALFNATYLQATFNAGQFSLFAYGKNEPDANQRNRPWIRLDANGNYIGIYTFVNGAWRRGGTYPIGFIGSYSGPASAFDGTGKGIAGTSTEGWSICNSNNGTPDLRDRFIVGANNYSGGWKTNVESGNTGASTGGSPTVRLNKNQIPKLTFVLGARTIKGGSGDSNNAFVADNSGTTVTKTIPGTGDPGNDTNESLALPHNNVPPFYALAFIQWQG